MIISEALSHLSKDDERIEVDENSPQHEREKNSDVFKYFTKDSSHRKVEIHSKEETEANLFSKSFKKYMGTLYMNLNFEIIPSFFSLITIWVLSAPFFYLPYLETCSLHR